LYILREKVTFSGGEVWGGLMYTVPFPKLYGLVLVNEIQVRTVSDYEMLAIYFE
jgi:hypothetical protein